MSHMLICCSIAHFARNRSEKLENLEENRDKKNLPNQIYLEHLSNDNIFECDLSNVYASHAFNLMILDTGCPKNIVRKVWFEYFTDIFNINLAEKVKTNPSESPVDSVNLYHPNDIKSSVPTTHNKADINDANAFAPNRNTDEFYEFVSIETPNENTNDSVTVNHTYQSDSVPVRYTNQNVQVVLPKQNQTVKYCHGQNPWETLTGSGCVGSRKRK